MKLLPRYATACGLSESDIGSQHLLEQFFPLPFTKYITLHAASGQAGKNYSFWNLVVELIKGPLSTRGIEIVQLGVKEDAAVPGCYHTMGKTDPHQASYLVSNALLHASNDSVWAHRAGHQNIPLVELFGSTAEANHAPYIYNKDKTVFLTSHRLGRNPSFSANESPKTIDFIDPFDAARSVLNLLDIPHQITGKTLYIGPALNASILEHVPNLALNPGFNPDAPTAIRMDLDYNEQILAQVLQSGRKVNIVTKAPINLGLLRAFAPHILSYNHEIDADCPVPYLKEIGKIIQNRTFFSRTKHEDELAALRFKFFDIVQIQHVTDKTRLDFEKAVREYLNKPEFSLDKDISLDRLKFRTNKLMLSKGKIYLSHAHEKADKPIEANSAIGQVIDSEYFWKDMHHFMVYTE